MSFNGQSNAWQRQQQQGYNSQMFMQGGFNQSNMFGAQVSYPQQQRVNPMAFQQSGSGQTYNSIGTVTKINSDCGLVNDEVFFYRNVCKGHAPKLGDRVLFEASYSTSGQFKWNATRIQLMPQQGGGGGGSAGGNMTSGSGKGGYGSISSNDYGRSVQKRQHSPPARRASPPRDRGARLERERRERERREEVNSSILTYTFNLSNYHCLPELTYFLFKEEHERKRRREDRSREPVRNDRERERDHDPKTRAIERSPHRTTVAKGRRTRPIRRYTIEIPKYPLA